MGVYAYSEARVQARGEINRFNLIYFPRFNKISVISTLCVCGVYAGSSCRLFETFSGVDERGMAGTTTTTTTAMTVFLNGKIMFFAEQEMVDAGQF